MSPLCIVADQARIILVPNQYDISGLLVMGFTKVCEGLHVYNVGCYEVMLAELPIHEWL